jgi:tRNA-dihydrouridine synthase B
MPREGFSLIALEARKLQIGSLRLPNPLVLAPLAGISDLPFRMLAKEQGCALVWTELISAEGLLRNRRASARLLHSCPEERPLAVQLFGSQARSLAEGARIAVEEFGADVLDINMGCPVRKVVRGGAGAALLKDIPRAAEILSAVRRAIAVPLTVKIRLGWDEKSVNYLEVARMAERCGVDGLILHGRTRMEGYGVPADWDSIARAQECLRVPVIGNGDLLSPRAIVHFFQSTGCAGAMIGRGAMGNPWIFCQALALLQGKEGDAPSLEERERVILRHLQWVLEIRGEAHGVREFRKHLIWYTRGLRGSSEFRARIPHWTTGAEMAGRLQEYFQEIRKAGHPALFA